MPSTALLIGHVSGVETAVARVRELEPDTAIHLLAYGRGPDDAPLPKGVSVIDLPALRPRVLGSFLRSLRRTGFDTAIVAQPRLDVSRARGALLGAAVASGARRVVALDLETGAPRSVARLAAAADAAAFVVLQVLAHGLATAAAPVLERLADRADATPAPTPPPGGSVAYLRTDLELALAPVTAGGSLAHTEGILLALGRRDHNVTMWTTGRLAGMPDGIEQRPLPTVLRANVPWEIAELVSGLRQARRLIREPTPRFAYQRYSLNNLAGVLAARRWRVALVLEANASEVQWRTEWSSLQFPRLARATERLVLRSADRIAAVSENAAVHLREMGDDADVRVVPNGVEWERFATAAPAKLPFEPGTFVIGFSGLFYPWHGVRYLAEAFVLARAQREAFRLLLIGDGEDAPLARSILERGGVMDSVHMPGLVDRDAVPGLLAAADALATPHVRNDRFIGSPIKVWEYMASGRPMVASAVAQLADVLRDGESALVVEPSDAEALAAALIRLHDDRELGARIGAAAQEEARERHSWDARLEQTLRG